MSLASLIEALPPYARDVSRNFEVLLQDDSLDEIEKWGALLVCAHAAGEAGLLRAVKAQAQDHLTPQLQEAAFGTAVVMAMNNVYFRAVHLMSDPETGALPSRLRMSALKSAGTPRRAAELWAVAVSALNGCGACLDAHGADARREGASAGKLQTALRIAAVIAAAASTLRAEAAGAV